MLYTERAHFYHRYKVGISNFSNCFVWFSYIWNLGSLDVIGPGKCWFICFIFTTPVPFYWGKLNKLGTRPTQLRKSNKTDLGCKLAKHATSQITSSQSAMRPQRLLETFQSRHNNLFSSDFFNSLHELTFPLSLCLSIFQFEMSQNVFPFVLARAVGGCGGGLAPHVSLMGNPCP